jgi:hypothetical protein
MRDIPGPRARRALAVLALVVLGASVATALRPRDVARDGRRLVGALRGEPTPLRDRFGFSFDPRYADFLAEVKRLTPENATVAVVVPRRPDVYVYQAYYQLAPRRVVEARWRDEASYVATYPSRRPEGSETSVAIFGGSLSKR